jgi:hypothetical protein
MKGARKNIFLIEQNIQEQLSQQGFGPLRVSRIKDAVTTVFVGGWLLSGVLAFRVGLGSLSSRAKGVLRGTELNLCLSGESAPKETDHPSGTGADPFTGGTPGPVGVQV